MGHRVEGRDDARLGIGHAVLLPHTRVDEAVVVEMTVFVVEHIAAVESEIEVAGSKRMLEVKT